MMVPYIPNPAFTRSPHETLMPARYVCAVVLREELDKRKALIVPAYGATWGFPGVLRTDGQSPETAIVNLGMRLLGVPFFPEEEIFRSFAKCEGVERPFSVYRCLIPDAFALLEQERGGHAQTPSPYSFTTRPSRQPLTPPSSIILEQLIKRSLLGSESAHALAQNTLRTPPHSR